MMFLKLENMCSPVIISFLFINAHLIVNIIKDKLYHGLKTYILGIFSILFLNMLCSYQYYKTAWVMFLIPVFLFIILNIMLIFIYKRSQVMNDTIKKHLEKP